MERRQLNAFADGNLDLNLKLAIARDLERLYSSLLAEPVPRDLRDFIDRLTRVSEQRR